MSSILAKPSTSTRGAEGYSFKVRREAAALPRAPRPRQSPLIPFWAPPAFGDGLGTSGAAAPATATRRRAFDIAQAPADARLVPLLELDRNMCAWPFDGEAGLFCGAPVDRRPGLARQRRRYCAHHGDIASGGAAAMPLKPSKEMRR